MMGIKPQYMQAATEHKISLGLYNVLLIIKKLSILYKHTSSILYMYFSEKKVHLKYTLFVLPEKGINEVYLANVLHLYFKYLSVL